MVYGDLVEQRPRRGMALSVPLREEGRRGLRIGRCRRAGRPDLEPVLGVVSAFAGAGLKWAQRRERSVPANECRNEATRMVSASSSDLGAGRWRGRRCAAALEDLDNDHARHQPEPPWHWQECPSSVSCRTEFAADSKRRSLSGRIPLFRLVLFGWRGGRGLLSVLQHRRGTHPERVSNA